MGIIDSIMSATNGEKPYPIARIAFLMLRELSICYVLKNTERRILLCTSYSFSSNRTARYDSYCPVCRLF